MSDSVKVGNSTINFSSCFEYDGPKVALAVLDPPYGLLAPAWDQNADALIPLTWELVQRSLIPNGVVVFTALQPYTSQVVTAAPKGWFRYALVWEKTKAVGHLLAKKRPMSAHEDILVFSPAKLGKHTYNPQFTEGEPYSGQGRAREEASRRVSAYRGCGGHRNDNPGIRYPRSVLTFKGVERGWHPTQKSPELCSWITCTYSNPGDLILEPFGGSCPFLRAAEADGRICTSFENYPEYVEKLKAEFGAA